MPRQPTVDVHAHVLVPAVETLVQQREGRAREIARQVEHMGQASVRRHLSLMPRAQASAETSTCPRCRGEALPERP
jgi:hypothetical protein